MLARILPFSGSRRDSTLLLYSPGFYSSLVLAWILPFSVLARTLFRYSPEFYPSPVLTWILTYSSTHPDSTHLLYSPRFYLSRYLSGPFSDTRPDSTLLRYSSGFYPSSVLAYILPFFGTRLDSNFHDTRPDPFPVLAPILPFTGTRPDSTILRYSPGFYPCPVLALILPFSCTCPDSPLLR